MRESVSIRSPLPYLLSELICIGAELEFKMVKGEPALLYSSKNGKVSGKIDLLEFEPGFHGANSIRLSVHLERILSEIRLNQ